MKNLPHVAACNTPAITALNPRDGVPVAELLPTAKPKTTRRILELDALRAISCLMLLLFHFTYVYRNKYGFASPLGFAFPYGKYGVQLFFMLSGLVNAMTLLKKRKSGEFVVSRFIRIFPSYWLMIVVSVWLFALVPMFQISATPDLTLANITTMPQLLGYQNMEPVTWTLQIEMLFYAFLVISLACGLLDRPFRTMMVAIGVCLICCTGLAWFKGACPASPWNGRFSFIENLFFMKNMPLFGMGILLNEIVAKRGNRWVMAGGILACGIVFHAIDVRDYNPAATTILLALLAFSAFGKIPVLRFKPLIYISTISYSLYLFHNNLGSLVIRQLENIGCSPLVAVLAATVFAIGLASAITFWFERPISTWLRCHWKTLKSRHEARNSASSINPHSSKLPTQ